MLVVGLRALMVAMMVFAFIACTSTDVDPAVYGDFQPTGWELVGPADAGTSELVIDVKLARPCSDKPIARADVTFAATEVIIATTIAEKKGCSLAFAFPGVVRHVIGLREPLGNRRLVDPVDLLPTPSLTPPCRANPHDICEQP